MEPLQLERIIERRRSSVFFKEEDYIKAKLKSNKLTVTENGTVYVKKFETSTLELEEEIRMFIWFV